MIIDNWEDLISINDFTDVFDLLDGNFKLYKKLYIIIYLYIKDTIESSTTIAGNTKGYTFLLQ